MLVSRHIAFVLQIQWDSMKKSQIQGKPQTVQIIRHLQKGVSITSRTAGQYIQLPHSFVLETIIYYCFQILVEAQAICIRVQHDLIPHYTACVKAAHIKSTLYGKELHVLLVIKNGAKNLLLPATMIAGCTSMWKHLNEKFQPLLCIYVCMPTLILTYLLHIYVPWKFI